MSVADPVRQLLDIEAIKQLKARYALLLDAKRWSDWRLLFTDDARFEGVAVPPDADADSFVAAVGELCESRTAYMHHHCHTPIIELTSATTARGLWALAGEHGPGHYEEEYRKEDDGWKISFLRLSKIPASTGVPPQGQAEWEDFAALAGRWHAAELEREGLPS
jgi:hypothetical protein